ncbi:heavy-metal-associated domain-containing protein [Chitiniphilus eburneus]|uniref:Heavy-metal-associated domain-containing protein n=1 Tax=Chitiniphilus eburneus TaxID=2571148 RepID=A0A4U0PLN9_9NEIS|nr:heavy-metal-associated domain-containing protein [Chitiniphilus eburneus]TJZ69046.1 heavy-metal-associated domain-containing protein [Chitiniphilus eburneus]
MEHINIGIEGMSCGGCVASVTRALQAVEGVTDVAVTLAPGAASVTFDPADTDRRTIETAIEDAGYDVVR